jgi:plasmid stabilization system protein ParE
MAYRVDISPSALADAEAAYFWIKEHTPDAAGEWYEGLLETIFSLENFPIRCSLAPESEDIGKEIRQLLYGKRGRTYRIIFAITRDEQAGEGVVRIFRIWHGARERIEASEIEEGESTDY